MLRVQDKLHHGNKVYNYFTRRHWNFVKNNILQVREELTEKDRQTFKLTNKGLNPADFFREAQLCARWYLMKEDPSNLPTARFRLKM